jgi:hypothetical protein
LRKLLLDYLVSLCITDSVSEDDEVCWEVSVMVLGEYLNRLFDQVLHPSFNDLLALRLDDVIRVVLTHFLIGGGRETDDAGGTGMADVNSDEHSAHVVHSLWEL